MKVLIFGLGLHGGGYAAASYFLDHGHEVRITDLRAEEDLKNQVASLVERGAVYASGEHRREDFLWADIVVKNPAIPPSHPLLKDARMVVNDFSWLFSSPWIHEVKIIAITGTKGKTTTSAAVAHVLEQMGVEAMQCGNMGISGFTVLKEFEERRKQGRALPAFLVCEFSSWQIRDTMTALGGAMPFLEICALTSFYPDHLNTYESIERYMEDKLLLFGPFVKKAVIPKIIAQRVRKQTNLDRKSIRWIDTSVPKELMESAHLHSAYAILLSLGFTYRQILEALSSFAGVPHRIEALGSLRNILFINDSAATIPEAVHFTFGNFKLLAVHLITGGTDKRLDPNSMIDELRHAASISLLEGSFTTDKLIPLLKSEKIPYTGPFATMGAALQASLERALVKEKELPDLQQVVLLSPGSASFELFDNEFDRGNQFRTLINLLIHAEASASVDTESSPNV